MFAAVLFKNNINKKKKRIFSLYKSLFIWYHYQNSKRNKFKYMIAVIAQIILVPAFIMILESKKTVPLTSRDGDT